MDKNTFIQSIKSKYPEYQNIDDNTLYDKVIEKYPVYKSQIKEPDNKYIDTSFGSAGRTISNAFSGGVDQAKQAIAESQAGRNPIETGLKFGAGALGAVFSPLAPLTKSIGGAVDDVANKLSDTSLIKGAAGNATTDAQGNATYTPNFSADRPIEDIGNAAAMFGAAAGSIKPTSVAQEALNKAKTLTINDGAVINSLRDATGSLLPDSAKTMDRVARLKPKDSAEFQTKFGKSHGEYLRDTGNFGAPDQIISNEAVKFASTLADKEATLSKLPGLYKSGAIDDVLSGLKEYVTKTSGDNVKSPHTSLVDSLIAKSKDLGLTMEEVNIAKKLYESKVRLGYNKMTTPGTTIEQATNIDSALRTWQDSTATKLGFTNIGDLSKQIQMSKFIINNLGDNFVGKAGNNAMNLTDWIILAGGDPTAVGGFLTKKFFGSKSVQAKIAEILNKEKIQAPIKADVTVTPENIKRQTSPTGALQLESGKSPTIENRVPIKQGPASSMEKGVPRTSTPQSQSVSGKVLETSSSNTTPATKVNKVIPKSKKPNSQSGMIKNPFEDIFKTKLEKITPEDTVELRDFTDYVDGSYKPKTSQIETDARRIAVKYGIVTPTEASKLGNKALSSKITKSGIFK